VIAGKPYGSIYNVVAHGTCVIVVIQLGRYLDQVFSDLCADGFGHGLCHDGLALDELRKRVGSPELSSFIEFYIQVSIVHKV